MKISTALLAGQRVVHKVHCTMLLSCFVLAGGVAGAACFKLNYTGQVCGNHETGDPLPCDENQPSYEQFQAAVHACANVLPGEGGMELCDQTDVTVFRHEYKCDEEGNAVLHRIIPYDNCATSHFPEEDNDECTGAEPGTGG